MVEAKGLKDRKTGQEQWKGKESGHAHVEGQWREQKGYGAYFDASGKRTENQWRVRYDVRTQEKEPPEASARSSPRGRYDVRTQEKERLEDREEPGWFHICSQGLEGVDLFSDEKAFIAGVNKFAAAFKLFGEDVDVVILVLVSTHFHSLAWGRKSDVIR